jgi:hypothetical protein
VVVIIATTEVASMLVKRRRYPMCRSITQRALWMALFTALAVLPGTALGAQPIAQFHDHFTDSFSAEVCGIAVDVAVVVTDNFFIYPDESVKDTSSVHQLFTNHVNGKSVLLSSAGQITAPAPIVDEEAGTITFIVSYKGLPEKIQTAQGPLLLRDAGVITFASTFDLVTGDFISSETTVHGPHPEADSDFTLFCEVITAALT